MKRELGPRMLTMLGTFDIRFDKVFAMVLMARRSKVLGIRCGQDLREHNVLLGLSCVAVG